MLYYVKDYNLRGLLFNENVRITTLITNITSIK